MTDHERKPDCVEFVVIDRATAYIVTAANMQVEQEGVELPGVLDSIRLYAEGEWVCQYDRGDDIDPQDAEFVSACAEAAGIELANRGGTLGVPGID